MYRGGLSAQPRPEHLVWSGTILAADHPWWKTHWPPNGWGYKCQVRSLSGRQIKGRGLSVSDGPPNHGSYLWEHPGTGEKIKIPNGIDPGWDYNPGQSAWGEKLSDEAMGKWKAEGAKAWERLTPGDWQEAGRAEKIPTSAPKVPLDFGIERSAEGMKKKLTEIQGRVEKIYSFETGSYRHDIVVNANSLAKHIDPNRAPYIPLIPEVMEEPYEVWQSFERHKGTGKVVLRQRMIKAIKTGKNEGMLMVISAVSGIMEAWTFIPVRNLAYLNRQRVGDLVFAREEE